MTQRQTRHLDGTEPMVREILRAAGVPDNDRKSIRLTVSDSINVFSAWSEGSRDTFTAIDLATMARKRLPGHNPMREHPSDAEIRFADWPGLAVVESSIFRGKHIGYTINIGPESATKLLPVSNNDVTEREAAILYPFASLIPAARQEHLSDMDATAEELNSLADRGYLKLQKGKRVGRSTEKAYNGKGYSPYHGWIYDLARAKVTVAGKNAAGRA